MYCYVPMLLLRLEAVCIVGTGQGHYLEIVIDKDQKIEDGNN